MVDNVDLILTATHEVIKDIATCKKKYEYRADSDYYAQKFLILDKKGNVADVKEIDSIKLHDRHGNYVIFSVKDLYFCTFEDEPLPDELKELEGDKSFRGCYVIEIDRILKHKY
jgi:hypothetical protein